ncbi:MAG: glycosyltransferase family 4 protein [Chloroflexi bacterium]|nr:glycosyltransferase family 4 protein [Chloroflexota bacterium]
MRICLPTGIFPPDIGGPASYVPRIAKALVERGHAVEVITLSDAPHDDTPYPFVVQRIPRGMARLPRMARTIARIAQAARRAEVVFANGLFIEAVLARGLVRRPLVMKVVGDWAWERATLNRQTEDGLEGFQTRRQRPRIEMVKSLRAWVTRRAQYVIVPSRFLADIVAQWGVARERVSVIYNAPDLAAAQNIELPPFGGMTLTVVGRLVPHKGIVPLLRVISTIPSVRLLIAGEGPSRDALEKETAGLGLQSRVIFLGSQSREAVAGLLGQANLMVLNSTYEGLPHVVLEAFAAGTPVLATRVGGTPEVVEHGVSGWLISSGDEAELGRAVRLLLEDPALRDRLREGGRRMLTQRFRWETLVEQTLAVLEGHTK